MGELPAPRRAAYHRAVAPARRLVCIAALTGLFPALAVGEVIRHTTPDGHAFHYMEMPDADRTAIAIDWESAWVHGARHPTAAHIGAMLMTSGGSGADLAALITRSEEVGAYADLTATADGARGLLVALDGRLAAAAALAREALAEPRLGSEAFESIRNELSRGVSAAETPAEAIVWDAARRLLLGNAPLHDFLRLPTEDIERSTLAEVRAWRDAVFARSNATIAGAGVAEPAEVAAAIDTLLEGLPEAPADDHVGAPKPRFPGGTVLIVVPDSERSAIGVFGPLSSAGEGASVLDVLALDALDRRLSRRVRREVGEAHESPRDL